MSRFNRVVIILLVTGKQLSCGATPLRVTIDCGSKEQYAARSKSVDLFDGKSRFDVNSFCDMIHRAVPKTVRDGRFVASEEDMLGLGDTLLPHAVAPPLSFIPKMGSKLKSPKLGIPKIKVPKLGTLHRGLPRAPSVGSAMSIPTLREVMEEETSAERMERFKKGVQKMLHVVKVLGQVDRYLSERTRVIVDKLAKTFAD